MPTTHRIRWKGRTEGPFTREEILLRLERGELSMLHRVEISGDWRPLSSLIEPEVPPPPPEAGRKPESPDRSGLRPAPSHASAPATGLRVRLAYALCGVTFLLPLVATLPALVVSAGLRRRGRRADGDIQFALIAVFTAAGLGFWHLVRQAFLAGRLG